MLLLMLLMLLLGDPESSIWLGLRNFVLGGGGGGSESCWFLQCTCTRSAKSNAACRAVVILCLIIVHSTSRHVWRTIWELTSRAHHDE